MRTGGSLWTCWHRIRIPLFALTVFGTTLFPVAAGAALISGSYELTWDQDVSKTEDETTDVRKFKQTLELNYNGFLSPVVENEISFKVEQEINSNAADTTRFLPTLDLGFKGNYWEAKAGAKRTHENSDEPGKNPNVLDNYFIELFYKAPRRVPDLKMKYTADKETEEGTTDTLDQEIALSSVYQPTDWLDMKGDYNRITNDDRLNADTDTEEEKISGSAAIRHFISEKIKVDSEIDLELIRGATLLDAGGAENQKEDKNYTWKNSAIFRPYRDSYIEGSYDYDLKQDKVIGEDTLTTTLKGIMGHTISIFDIKGEYNQVITEARHTADDNKKTEDTWTADVKFRFSKQLDFSVKYQEKDTEEVHVDPSNDSATELVNWVGTWDGELAPFWKATVSYDRTDTFEQGTKTTVDTKYSYKSTFDFKAIYLTLDPTYDINVKEDLQASPAVETETRDFRFKIAWQVFPTINTEVKFDHTYGRKVDTEAGNIQRTDDTNWNLTWLDPVPGWTASFDLTRNATDTSEDDLGPDITSTFGFKVDYKGERLFLNMSYQYDKKSLSDDSETFNVKIGWTETKWDASLTYTFDKTFAEELNEGYTVSLAFKYNL